MIDLSKRADVEAFIAREQRWTLHEFKRKGRLHSPHAIVFATVDPSTSEPFAGGVGIIPIWPAGMQGTSKQKDVFSSIIESIALKCRAIGVLVVMESWLLAADRMKNPARFEQLKERVRTHGGLGSSIEHEPDREEAIVLSLEHLAFPPGAHMWFGRITRDAGGAATVAPFEYMQPEQSTGRFVHLFHRENFA